MPDTITYPTINLYLYDLKDGLGDDNNQIAQNTLTATAISIQQPPLNSYTNFSFITSPVFVLSFLPSAPFLIILLYRLLISRNKINH